MSKRFAEGAAQRITNVHWLSEFILVRALPKSGAFTKPFGEPYSYPYIEGSTKRTGELQEEYKGNEFRKHMATIKINPAPRYFITLNDNDYYFFIDTKKLAKVTKILKEKKKFVRSEYKIVFNLSKCFVTGHGFFHFEALAIGLPKTKRKTPKSQAQARSLFDTADSESEQINFGDDIFWTLKIVAERAVNIRDRNKETLTWNWTHSRDNN